MDAIEKQEILNKISEIEGFTSSFWWPAYKRAEEDIALTPTAPAIIMEIIENRGKYVMKLKEKIKPQLGDKDYQTNHSIDVNGNCNLGCC